MEAHRDLIEKFLRSQCTDAEAELVQKYFNEHPGSTEQYIPLNDWLANSEKHLSISVSERILQRIRETYGEKKQRSLTKSLLQYAAAASVIGIVILGSIQLFTKKTRQHEETVAITTSIDSAQKWKMIQNNSTREMQVTLPDGSGVTVYPNSSLQYLPAFEKNRRDLFLKGKALFQIIKDASRPFTVYALGIATTALGTKFLVSALSKRVSIDLLEGSVKVWPQYAAENGKFVVLHPGDELVVSNDDGFSKYSLSSSSEKNLKNSTTKASKNHLVKVETQFVFKNLSLQDVFKQIEKKFGVTINYEATAASEEKLFTGTFLKKDSLEFICRTICGLHGLQYKIEGNTITVSSQ